MKYIKKIIKGILFVLALPVLYLAIAFMLTFITVNSSGTKAENSETIYISTNGLHLDIILAKEDLDGSLVKGLKHSPSEVYFSFSWGDENFYLNTPYWSDLTFRTAFNATFLRSPSLMHVVRYQQIQTYWVKINISKSAIRQINQLILQSFRTDANGNKILLEGEGYYHNDNFYKARGSYSCFKTCNTWVNTIFKKSGLKACLWTPFDFGLIKKYE